jgi:uncharacterized protein
MKARIAALVLIAVLVALPAFAGEISGSYRIEQDGNLLGAEKFEINFAKDGGINSTSTGTIREDDTSIESFTEVQFRSTGELKDYQREIYVNKVPKKLVGVNQGPHLEVKLNTGLTNVIKKVSIHPKTIVLETGTFHHFHYLVRRYSKNGPPVQKEFAVVPSELREIEVSIKFIESGAVEVAKGYFKADKYFVNMGDVGVTLWVDTVGRIVKIEIPMQGYTIELKGYKGVRAEKVEAGKIISRPIYRSDITFSSADGTTMGGVITKPKNLEGGLPTLVFISTSGPQDRDGINTVAGLPTHTGAILDRLSQEGFLILRFDDRGVGTSGGDFAQTSLSRQAADVNGAFAFLKTRQDVDPNRMGLIGHGEGANIALQMLAENSTFKAGVLLAPSSEKLTSLAIDQVKKRLKSMGDNNPDAYKGSPIYRLIDMSRNTGKKFQVLGARGIYLDNFREWDKMNPTEEIGKVSGNVLHIQGGNDRQVFPEYAAGIKKAPKKGKYTYKEFPNLDHFFVKSDGSIGAYSDPDRKIDEAFLKYLTAWLAANL